MWRRRIHDKVGLFDPSYQSAGDLEFWLRAAFAGYHFLKLDEIVSAYYHNPSGLSTRFDGAAHRELVKIQEC